MVATTKTLRRICIKVSLFLAFWARVPWSKGLIKDIFSAVLRLKPRSKCAMSHKTTKVRPTTPEHGVKQFWVTLCSLLVVPLVKGEMQLLHQLMI